MVAKRLWEAREREGEMPVASFNYIGLHKSHSSMSEDGRFVVRIANQMHTYVRTGTAIIVYALLNSRKCVAICPNGTEQNEME